VNRIVDPWLVRQGAIAGSNGELGLLEHIGRKSGIVRISPIHPVWTNEGLRIVVPLGVESQWVRNVIAAGHCRLQVGESVYDLDEPRLVLPSEIDGLPRAATRLMEWLGFRYLVLRRFAERPGSLTVPVVEPVPQRVEPAPAETVPAA
jgi:deazaflavin-dependent oxidoreductase (nitroreductase family)